MELNITNYNKVVLKAAKFLRGEVNIPPDKSIAHRAIFLNIYTCGKAKITNYLEGIDNWATINCLRALGIEIKHEPNKTVIVKGIGLEHLNESSDIMNVGTSATTMRFLCGLLAPHPIYTVITGVPRTNDRPMQRVTEPLTRMGATFLGRNNNTTAPLAVKGASLTGIEYDSMVSSSEVKTALLLAALKCQDGKVVFNSPFPTRDHTERILRAMGHKIEVLKNGCQISMEPLSRPLNPIDYEVPGEISAAVYWIVLGLVHPDSDITIKKVCINPLRTGLLDILQKMGGDIELIEYKNLDMIEPIADIRVKTSKLKGVTIEPEYFTRMIDEFPGFALAASLAEGTTIIKGAGDLRNKKSNRIACIVEEYSKLGANVIETEDGMIFEGVSSLKGNLCKSHGDHRLGNSLIVAGLVADGETTVYDVIPVTSTSYPTFWKELSNITSPEVIIQAE